MLGRLLAYTYGTITLACVQLAAFADPSYWRKDTEEETESLKRANEELWSLSAPSSKHTHGFLTLDNAVQLHYLRDRPENSPAKAPALVIFLHGFPDSAHIFGNFLDMPYESDKPHIHVSLDLPGYGGSDSLTAYGPNDVLDAIAEGIVKLKAMYLASSESPTEPSRCVLVGHDWGGAVAYRIAPETKGLVDSVIVANSAHTPHAQGNIKTRLRAAHQDWSRWLAAPYDVSLLRSAWHQITPVMTQLVMSGYIFMFNLPFRTAKWRPSLVRYLVRWVITYGHFREQATIPPNKFASALSSCFGPTAAECATHLPDGSTYGKSVLDRSLTNPPGDWDEKVRLYREGLASRKWKTNEQNSRFLVAADDDSKHSLRNQRWPPVVRPFQCPVTIVYGLQDLALDPRIMLDGIERYFASYESQGKQVKDQTLRSDVVRLPNHGHWSMIEEKDETGFQALVATVLWRTQRRGVDDGGDDAISRSSSMWDDQDLQHWMKDGTQGDVQITTV